MNHSVRTLPRAEGDIRNIAEFIYQRSPKGAAAWLDAVADAMEKLAVNPERFGVATESKHFEIDVRESPFKTKRGRVYRLLFTIVDNEVFVLRVRGPGQAALKPDELV